MQEIMLYVFRKYGLKISESEAKDFLEWFKLNKERISDEEKLDIEAKEYLYDKYKGRTLYLYEEDLSNMKYLLTLLKNETMKK